jgi:RimJ/RimL family protein N-acetyltransferase
MDPLDADCWYDFMALPEIAIFLPDRFETREEMQATLLWLVGNYDMDVEEIIRITLAIHPDDGGKMPRGFVSYGPLPEDNCKREIAYAVHPDWQGRGLATEAARVFIEWVREQITRKPLYASVDAANTASIRVLEKLGFTCEEDGRADSGLSGDALIFRRE